MEPITPMSNPRRIYPRVKTTSTRGRSPAPRPQLQSPSCTAYSDSTDLIFPMSPVICDTKEINFPFYVEPSSFVIAQSPIPHPIVVDLTSNTARKTQINASKKENRKSRSKPAAPHRPSEPLFLSNIPNISRRIASFLKPTASVMATPTAVTVRRSSQPDGLSSFIMEEHTTAAPTPTPSQPVQISRLYPLRGAAIHLTLPISSQSPPSQVLASRETSALKDGNGYGKRKVSLMRGCFCPTKRQSTAGGTTKVA